MIKSFTSESVTCGHPDKVCDQIADAVLDTTLRKDPAVHCACEAAVSGNQVHIFGETSTDEFIDYINIAREKIREIGYVESGRGFDADTCRIRVDMQKQSADIARGVHRRGEADDLNDGAGDQGIMFGYACRETESMMPLPIELAHALTKKLEEVRRRREIGYLLPDGKAQVTVDYEDGLPKTVSTIVVSAQHREGVTIEKLREDIWKHVILAAIPHELLNQDTQIFINPTGRFVIGGPAGDSGLTGRKLIADTYGGYARNGGGAMSGKDPSKVDRSGAYMARYIAKNIVAAGLADRCEVQLAYAIGLAEPVSLWIDTAGTAKVDEEALIHAIQWETDLRPAAITRKFHLTEPKYEKIACYGQFGTNALEYGWEQTDLAERLVIH